MSSMTVSLRKHYTWSANMIGSGNAEEMSLVARPERKISNEGSEVTCWDKLFQIRDSEGQW